MKISIKKSIIKGKYHIIISVNEFSIEERQKMDKFGVPIINIKPSSVLLDGRYTELLPLDRIRHDFQFNNAMAADTFAESIRRRIRLAINILRRREDKFSESKQYEI